jgi:STE24 endopeptidase
MPGITGDALNLFGIIVLLALIADYGLQLVAGLLNLRELRLEVPDILAGIYNPEDYSHSQEYTRTTTRFGFIHSTFSLLVILGFWFGGGFNFVDGLVRGWGFHSIVTGLFYIGILIAGYAALNLPFNIYHTFVIEQRYGFNRTTPGLFTVDLLKQIILGLGLGGLVLTGALALFEYGGTFAWLYVWLAAILFSLGVQFVAPVWIMPLFNKFTPMAEGELKRAILDYAGSMKFPIKNVFVIDSSKRSTRSNAFFTGFGRNKRIALFDTLIKQHTTAEIVAVLAHEIGHYKKKHIIQGMLISIIHSGIVLFLLSIFLQSPGLYQAFFMNQTSIYTGLLFFSLLYTPVELVLSVVMNIISRRNETEADRFAMMTTRDSVSLADALKKLAKDNLSNLTPHPFYVFLNYSHPTLLQRVRAILS